MLTALGRVTAAHRRLVLIGALLMALLASIGVLGLPGRLSYGGYLDPGSDSSLAEQAIRDRVGSAAADVLVVYRSSVLDVHEDPEFRSRVQHSLRTAPEGTITSAMTFWDTQNITLVSEDRHATIVAVMLAGRDDNERAASHRKLRDGLTADGLRITYAGTVAVLEEIAARSQDEIRRTELTALPLVLLLLIIVFRSVVAALLPLLLGGLTTVVTLAMVRCVTEFSDFSLASLNAVVAVGLALGVDSALLVVSRFREELGRQATVPDAVVETVATAGRTVLYSGLTISGIALGLLFFPFGIVRSFGTGSAIAAGAGAILSVTVLPAVLALLGHRVNSLRIPWPRRNTSSEVGSSWWARLARAVMANPVPYAAGVLAGLVLLTVPFFHTKFAFPDERTLPANAPARMATEEVRREFSFAGLAAVQIVTTFADRLDTPRGAEALRTWTRQLSTLSDGDGGLVAATVGHTAVIYLRHDGKADEPPARDLVHRVRALPAPPGGEVVVGGPSAMAMDSVDRIMSRLGWALLYVVVFAFVLLVFALRSIILPVKALLVNAMSLGACFGVLTWMFGDGHLIWLVGGTRTGHIDLFEPVIMLFLVIALAMDYELFLLCRIREQYERLGDNTAAVAFGIQRSGPIITSAALVVLVVFAVFARSDIVFIKQLCVGMFVAVVLDATVVRLLLVPAVMRLLGRANWWFPLPNSTRTNGPLQEERTVAPERWTERDDKAIKPLIR